MRTLLAFIMFIFSLMILLGGCDKEIPTPQQVSFTSTYIVLDDTVTTSYYTYNEQSYGKVLVVDSTTPSYSIIFDTIYTGIVNREDYNITIRVYTPDSAVLFTSVNANVNNNSFLTIQEINDSTYSGTFNAEYNVSGDVMGKDSIFELNGNFTGFIK